MKKVILTVVAALACATMAFSQESEIRTPNGYQGFIEEGNLFHFDGESSINLSTTHGFYFGGHTFAGIGVGAEFNNDCVVFPFYTSIKYVLNTTKSVSPCFSMRLGSYLGEDQGAYGDAAVGIRFATSKDFAVSVMVGATYYDTIEESQYWDSVKDQYVTKDINFSGLSVRCGIEW
ncbi:MAG: hypothetical protein IKP08_03440 [Bacteroidales bacterium]|nr:hypothetical protein [Bacteroidales bacterium]